MIFKWITWVSDSIHIWNNSELKEDPDNILNVWKNNKNCFRYCCLLFNISIGLVNTCYKSCRLVDFTTLNTKVHSHRRSIKINTQRNVFKVRESLLDSYRLPDDFMWSKARHRNFLPSTSLRKKLFHMTGFHINGHKYFFQKYLM